MIESAINTSPSVCIIVLNWNGKDDTVQCLASLRRLDYDEAKVVVVDNGSQDGSVDEIKRIYPDVHVIENNANLGYAGGNNVGIKHSLANDFDFVLLLNNDTECDPGFVTGLVGAMQASPEAAFAGPLIYFFEPKDKIWSCGVRWDSASLSFDLVQSRAPKLDTQSPFEVESLVGCALLARCEHLRVFGLLDERYFLMHEESDWCYRAKAAGFKCLLAPSAVIWHKVSVSFGGAGSPLMQYFSERNMLLWASSHLPTHLYLSFVFRKFVDILKPIFSSFGRWQPGNLRSILWQLAGKARNSRAALTSPTLKAKATGFRDYFLRRFGPCPPWIRNLKRNPN
jgi:GT2 family glycosyltransferase